MRIDRGASVRFGEKDMEYRPFTSLLDSEYVVAEFVGESLGVFDGSVCTDGREAIRAVFCLP